MSTVQNPLLNLFKELTPTDTSKENIPVDAIDKAPLPKFAVERKVVATNSPAFPSVPLPPGGDGTASPGAATPGSGEAAPTPEKTETLTVISDEQPLTLSSRFGESNYDTEYMSQHGVTTQDLQKAVKEAALIPRSASFEIFNRNHLNACDGLIQVFYYMAIRNLQEAIQYARKYVNEELLNYCINVVSRHRSEFVDANIQLPSHIASHPSTYVDVSKLDNLLYARGVKGDGKKITDPIEIDSFHDFTATDADPEHLVAYFREDVGINLHHRHWHEVYPNTGPKEIVNLDRRGELFVYMHAQLLARYNFERLCNSLDPVQKFSNFREPIMQAYYPKLDEASEVKVWSPRQPFAQLQDVNRDGLEYEVKDLERWLERLIDTIDRGWASAKEKDGKNSTVILEEPSAINALGNTIDSVPSLSYDPNYYGDLHTTGHILIAYCHDPDKRFRELGGVMGKLEAALRDPMFYRWHAFVDDVIERYRSRKLKPYSLEERLWENVIIDSVDIDSGIGEKNIIDTYWQLDRVDVTDGILSLKEVDLKKRPSKVYVKFKHLQHKDFNYRFRIYNNNFSKPTVTGIVRVFMAPAHDETRNPMKFNKLRRYMIELDKFTITLRQGKNEFVRPSTCSSVTVPFEQTFMTFDKAQAYSNDEKIRQELLSYCGCGLPHHLLIGRGRESGFPCTLFVMITDYANDKVEDSTIASCSKASVSFCGVRNKKYPDRRPMGFPFDRPIPDSEAYLETFMTKSQKTHDVGDDKSPVQNMYANTFKVRYTNKIEYGQTCDETCEAGLQKPGS